MEGLIKGLIDVALGHDNRDDEEPNPQARDERSRSSWAQVVSGEPDEGEEGSDRSHGYTRNQWDRQEKSEMGSQAWELAGSRPSKQPEMALHDGYINVGEIEQHGYERNRWNREENEGEKKDEWKTVGEKPRRKPHNVFFPIQLTTLQKTQINLNLGPKFDYCGHIIH